MKLPNCFRLAKKVSSLSDHPQHKLGAVILINRKPVSVGYNKLYKTHPIMKKYGSLRTLHAELSAILQIQNKALLQGATMVVYRSDKQGNPKNARPCSTCEEILKSFGITKTIYTVENGYRVEEIK